VKIFHEEDLPDDECSDNPGHAAATKPRTMINRTPAERAEWLAMYERCGQGENKIAA
jgi:hypothetical protein